jgi:hypothetical protein
MKDNFEGHLQTLLTLCAIGVIGWVGLTVTDNANVVARLEERVNLLTERIEDFRELAKTRYTRAEALRDFDNIYQRFEIVHERLEIIEKKLKNL